MSATRCHDADLDMMDNSIRNAKIEGYYSKTEVDELIGGLSRLEIKVVDSLPATGEFGYIYLVPAASSKTKNIKDEYIWIGDDWELIGSTQFKLDIVQDELGISINNVGLQDASETQSGLMTKEMVGEFRSKQDALQPGANIVIENGVISATGGGSGGHSSCVRTFGGDGLTEYKVVHNLNTFNVLFQMRTVSPPIQFVQSTVYADDENTLRVVFAEPLTSVLSMSILACDVVVTPDPEPEPTLDIDVKTISGTTTWTHANDTGSPIFCMLYDVDGNEIYGDIVQNSADGFDPVVATTDMENDSGYMVVAKADIMETFENITAYSIDVANYGYTEDDKFLVMVFVDGMGQNYTQAAQVGSIVTIEFGESSLSTGYVILRKATATFPFENLEAEPFIAEHNLGRYVGAQLFIDGDLQGTDVDCIDLNTCKAEPVTGTGYLAII